MKKCGERDTVCLLGCEGWTVNEAIRLRQEVNFRQS